MSLPIWGSRQLLVGLDQNFAGLHVDHVGGHVGALEVVGADLDLLDLGLLDFLEEGRGDLAALRDDGVAALGVDGVRELQADQRVGDLPEDLLVLQVDFGELVERAQDVGVGFEAEGAKEHRAVELALAVDADVQQVLVVVLELDPAAAVGNDLAEVVALGRERARRTRPANGATG